MSSAPHRDPEMDGLLVKYLLGEASAEERETVTHWCALDPANRKYFDDFRVLWDTGQALAPATAADPEAAWARFVERRAAPASERPTAVPSRGRRFVLWAAAAAAVVILAGAFWLLRSGRAVVLEADTAALTATLPDGSTVTLNAHSSMRYQDRTVILFGEGFFTIAPDARKPFTVMASGITVRVLGTSFNVHAYDLGAEVVVETGKVEVSAGKGRHEVLEAGDQVQASFGLIQKTHSSDELYQYYRTRLFVCRNTSLRDLMGTVSEAYDMPVRLETADIERLPITGSYRMSATPDSLLDVVTQTLGLTWTRKGKEIIIR